MLLPRLLVGSTVLVFTACTNSKEEITPILYDLDTKIANELSKPTQGKGSKVMQDIGEYNHRMFNALQLIDQGVSEMVAKGKKMMEMGGPQILNTHIDRGLLRNRYSWGEDEIHDLDDELREANETWYEVKEKIHEIEARGNSSSSPSFSSWEFVGEGMSSKNQDESIVEYVSNETGKIHVNDTGPIHEDEDLEQFSTEFKNDKKNVASPKGPDR